MNIFALLLIALGIGLVIVGWNGTYANVWQFLSGQGGSSGSSAQQPAQTTPGPKPPTTPGGGISPQTLTQYQHH